MNYKLFLPLFALALTAQAQDTYLNERLTNNSSDVIGTARYVGMGGALGALGADISTISWNPAGIGLYRKNDIALTFGGIWGKSRIEEASRGKGTIDQAGFVFNVRTNSETVPYVNFAFNFQKKINFNHNFYADNYNLNGLSQMDQVAEMTAFSDYYDWKDGYQPNLANLAWDEQYLNADGQNTVLRDNSHTPSSNTYTHHTEGSLQAFDFNLSTNINNRAFIGLTVGVDNMLFSGYSWYGEYIYDGHDELPRYDLYNDYRITGTGVNVKLGTIIRPFADSPFRVGLAVETPTWYHLKNSTIYTLRYFPDDYIQTDNYSVTDDYESYLKFNLRSPWKFRASIGSTVGNTLAWDVDYEFADYVGMSMGYPEYEDDWDGSTSGNIKDVAMNRQTRKNLRGTHTLRAGLEINATKNLAFRLGYNLSTSAYEKSIDYDQFSLAKEGSEYAHNYTTGTSFMRMGTTNILTLGVGYRIKNFYVDLAYKLRNQFADFYAFDTNFTDSEYGNPVFLNNNPGLADMTINPVNVDLTRHAITCTLGFKF